MPDVRLWIDTNVARSVTAIEELCSLAQSKGVEVVVHAQVYLERRRQMRTRAGGRFSEVRFDGFLRQYGIQIIDIHLDHPTAARWADSLCYRYPTDRDWELAKQRTLGGELIADFKIIPGKMPMTTDWLIALAVEDDAASRIITHDEGEEWRRLREAEPRRALSWDEAVTWLQSLPEDGPSPGRRA
ncbi:hypothetical protein BE20_45390 [Sorangium cellulosum]|uniref:PIN domain-containing protein n=1 Tax=Sorangium cellulosum TaxID=56 RepID=A0A150SET1_SORCE|nr:hypothetical protein BE18_35995 [Sorangium cellulosum]KYF95464.1 hypothetical protein BE20_45390 [Sorangium cellulosum]